MERQRRGGAAVNQKLSDLSDDPFSQFRLAGKVAIVTGASSGLGAHFVQTLHAAGAEVIATARRSDLLEGVCAGLAHASWIPADLMLGEERERLVSEVVASHGKIDVLVNNAGMSRPGPIESESLQDFRTVLELNVTAVWHMTKLVGEFMVKVGHGSIVNVASVLGHVASAPMSQANYAASKGAVINLTREIAVQWARSGVRVNALCPGFFPSELTEDVVSDPKTLAFVERGTPMGRMGELSELDGPLLLLCSEASRYMTGTSLLVDGGWTAR
jgi:NAD(P)-dependent dehydrogenase (short-subunit alcohol dehydrogenase family)